MFARAHRTSRIIVQMRPDMPSRDPRSMIGMIIFLVSSLVVLYLVSFRYLVPALKLTANLTDSGKLQLRAISSLVLAIVLTTLIAFALLAIRPGRFFLPRRQPPRTRTNYPDAWTESGKRLQVPGDEDEGPRSAE